MAFEDEEGVDSKRMIGRDCHSIRCYTADSKLECCCGLEEVEYHESNREPEPAPLPEDAT